MLREIRGARKRYDIAKARSVDFTLHLGTKR
jgi:hypothetical protein